MKKNNIELEILGKSSAFREFHHEGKTFVESREDGHTYSLRIKNNTSGRVSAVVSVDGVNVIDGKATTDKPNEVGYILNAHQEMIVKGFRISDDEVAAFKFVKKGESYATSLGNGAGNGVIAIRVYEEKEDKTAALLKRIKDLESRPREKEYVPVWPNYPRPLPRPYWGDPYYEDYTRPRIWCGAAISSAGVGKGSSAHGDLSMRAMGMGETVKSFVNCSLTSSSVENAMQCAAPEEDAFSHGTAWAEAVADKVTHVTFEVGDLLAEIAIYYAPRVGLEALGVKMTKEKAVSFPQPFKREYCAPPSGWRVK